MRRIKKYTTNIKLKLLLTSVILSSFVLTAPALVEADCNTDAKPGSIEVIKNDKGEVVRTEKIEPKAAKNSEIQECLEDNRLAKRINQIVTILSAGVGVVVTGSIIWGGIQYAMAGNNPNQVNAAKQRILNSVLALLFFIFMFAFLQWLIPGKALFKL